MKKFILITTVVLSAGALSSATNKNENKPKMVVAPVNSLTTGFKRDLGSAD
ncbi:hypothetical protein [Mucilaginibacter sp. SJ]|uniref:hypothetical protein n=1 Tax=Mucilaginibacter sp. SJ TaxID=3029053 RepID=UPI0023A978AE|nr:hypothetical protein [Mucilaginibacter sp. SJ]WEA02679.1 hypothetical protein MusilaSJ_07010 [Mucilaginibacter sp. SJ]